MLIIDIFLRVAASAQALGEDVMEVLISLDCQLTTILQTKDQLLSNMPDLPRHTKKFRCLDLHKNPVLSGSVPR
jgi:hypothetical protein